MTQSKANQKKTNVLPLKLVCSLILGETINNNPHFLNQNHHQNEHEESSPIKQQEQKYQEQEEEKQD
jgi:hypothetical protein